ncbi:MAG: outer membrane protein assembly factor BamD [Planctomycetota bacterium]|nr:MAG: outer membrane protein assembly factor BamD [Planctomycetota bacterium]
MKSALPPLLLALLAACSSAPEEPCSSADLEPARALAAAGDYDGAAAALADFDREDFDRAGQSEYSLLAGDVAYAREDWDQAIHHYEEYLLSAGLASESERVEERLFEMAMQLLNGERRAFGIFPDRGRGVVTLHNLATWAPNSPWAAQALATAANYSFSEGQYAEAAMDYRQLLEQHPDSEFTDLANFRLGMCGFLQIDGPWVDGRLIERSAAQLRFYLDHYPSGLYRSEAEQALARLERWSGERELLIGDYYETIDNVRGARYHYQRARTSPVAEIAREAERLLAALPPNPPLEVPADEQEAGG